MKNLFQILLLTLLFNSPALLAKEEIINRIDAIVNHDIVLMSQVNSRMKQTHPQFASLSEFELIKLKQKTLETLIEETLVMQESEKLDIMVEEEEIDQQIENILQQNRITLDQLKEFLARDNKTFPQYREEFEKRLQMHQFMKMVIRPKVKVSDDDIDFELVRQGGKDMLDFIQFHIKHIFLKKESPMADKIGEIYQQIQEGANFEEMAKKHSEDTMSGNKGGDLGFVAKRDISEPFKKRADFSTC